MRLPRPKCAGCGGECSKHSFIKRIGWQVRQVKLTDANGKNVTGTAVEVCCPKCWQKWGNQWYKFPLHTRSSAPD